MLSHSVRELPPLKSLITEVIERLVMDSNKVNFVSIYTFYEDKNSNVVVAEIPRITSTSKQISIKYHLFRNHVGREFMIWNIE